MSLNWELNQKETFLKKISGSEMTKIKEMLWLDFIDSYPQWLEIDTQTYLGCINEKNEGSIEKTGANKPIPDDQEHR